MATPIQRSPIRPARGLRSEMERALTAGELPEGELVWMRDEQKLYIVECITDGGSSSLVFTPIDEDCCTIYTFAPAPHSDARHGDRWTSSIDGRPYIYTDDGSTGQWVQLAT